MPFSFFKKCDGCKQIRWYIAIRRFNSPFLKGLKVTSQNQLCGMCYKIYKQI